MWYIEKSREFFLECHDPVPLFLAINILNDSIDRRFSNRKNFHSHFAS